MRVTTLHVAVLAVGFALSTAVSAQTTRVPSGNTVPPEAMAPATKSVKQPTVRPTRAPGGTKGVPLTTTECGNLGGVVKDNITACLSGKACQTTGEDKQVHAVCISKAQ